MADKKRTNQPVANPGSPARADVARAGVQESLVADVFEGRHPSESEKKWAEGMLAKSL